MPRTRGRRDEVPTPDPAAEERADAPEAPPPTPALSEIPRVETHPAVVEAGRRLAEAETKLVAAAKRVAELTEGIEGKRDRVREAEKLFVLAEVTAEDVEAARADVARFEPQLTDARSRAAAWRDAVEDLTARLERAKEQARLEVAAGLIALRRERIAHIAEAHLTPLAVEMARLYHIEREMKSQGVSLEPTGPMTIGELLATRELVTNESLVFGFGAARLDGLNLLRAWLERARRLGVEVAAPDLEVES